MATKEEVSPVEAARRAAANFREARTVADYAEAEAAAEAEWKAAEAAEAAYWEAEREAASNRQ